MARMKSGVRWQTKECVKCYRPAKMWGGAVRFGREWVLAGWCRRCGRDKWFHGDYSPRMGRERAE